MLSRYGISQLRVCAVNAFFLTFLLIFNKYTMTTSYSSRKFQVILSQFALFSSLFPFTPSSPLVSFSHSENCNSDRVKNIIKKKYREFCNFLSNKVMLKQTFDLCCIFFLMKLNSKILHCWCMFI